MLIISNGEKIHSDVNVKQVKGENNSLPVAVRVSGFAADVTAAMLLNRTMQ